MSTHKKHSQLTKPHSGTVHPHEWAILGTPCGEIKKLAYQLIQKLSPHKVGYLDADHKGADEAGGQLPAAIGHGATLEYTDKIDFHRLDINQTMNAFDFKQQFASEDIVLINGNHFAAGRQIAVIDSRKPLEKKVEKLTNVALILMQHGEKGIPDVLKNTIPDISKIPCFSIDDIDNIAKLITQDYSTPLLQGLVLAGGKSQRMQRDKGAIKYHSKEQRLHMYDLLDEVTHQAWLSVSHDNTAPQLENTRTLPDTFINLGPMGAILSAFRQEPNCAWFTTACDQPLITKSTLDLLIARRNPSKVATAFFNSETGFPEPLLTIWEPRAYARLLYFLSQGYSCPRKALINSDVEIVKLEDETVLKNANTPEEYQEIMKILEVNDQT